MIQGTIDLASGTGNTTLITTGAGQHFWCPRLQIACTAAGTIELFSGATSLTGEVVVLAGAQYTWENLRSRAVGDDLILARTGTATAVGGSYDYTVK